MEEIVSTTIIPHVKHVLQQIIFVAERIAFLMVTLNHRAAVRVLVVANQVLEQGFQMVVGHVLKKFMFRHSLVLANGAVNLQALP